MMLLVLVDDSTHVSGTAGHAQARLEAPPHRVVSLLSREAADELGLEPQMLVVAAVKATNVSVEIPARGRPG
jgi:molybdopterin-binding protein